MEQTLGKRISSHRKGLGLTQDQLAEQLGITAQAVSKWENDQSCPDITMLPRLAKIFGTTTDALLGVEAAPVREAELVAAPEPEAEPEGVHIAKGDFELTWGGGRKDSLTLAILVLLVGGLLLAGRLLNWEVSFWGLLWPGALLVFGLMGLFPRFGFVSLGCTLLGGFFLAEELGLLPEKLQSGIVFPALLLLFGLSLLAEALGKSGKRSLRLRGRDRASHSFRQTAEGFQCETSFGEDRQDVTVARLAQGEMNCSFGELTVDLTRVEEAAPDCCLEANCSFGDLTILLPRRFRGELETSTAFGSVDVSGHPDAGAVPIRLVCSVSFGEITVRYL